MTEKKATTKKAAASKAAPKKKAPAKSTASTSTAKKSASKPKTEPKTPKPAPPDPLSGVPDFVKRGPNEHIVGTEDYGKLIAEGNKLFGTQWNTHRVKPAVFYGIWKKVFDHYYNND